MPCPRVDPVTAAKIIDMLADDGTWEAPEAYDDLLGGVHLLIRILRSDMLDERPKTDALRWISEATEMLLESRRPSQSESKP